MGDNGLVLDSRETFVGDVLGVVGLDPKFWDGVTTLREDVPSNMEVVPEHVGNARDSNRVLRVRGSHQPSDPPVPARDPRLCQGLEGTCGAWSLKDGAFCVGHNR